MLNWRPGQVKMRSRLLKNCCMHKLYKLYTLERLVYLCAVGC